MNVFVLCTGRCGSVTLYKICKHIQNFTSGHESRKKLDFKYQENHIEIDNRLSWFLGRLDDKFIINPSDADVESSDIDIVVSGTADSVVMVEGVSNFITEDDVLSAIQYAHAVIKDIVQAQLELVKECGQLQI